MKYLCHKWKVKLFFSWRLKQFDGLTSLTPIRYILRQIYAIEI